MRIASEKTAQNVFSCRIEQVDARRGAEELRRGPAAPRGVRKEERCLLGSFGVCRFATRLVLMSTPVLNVFLSFVLALLSPCCVTVHTSDTRSLHDSIQCEWRHNRMPGIPRHSRGTPGAEEEGGNNSTDFRLLPNRE